ncbi:hypothetical protein [Nocardia flavorosea]|uniref:Uncharacterized protein n=1 Tax=Nocardia flavorosea TaxID=53429 RepID=A0A846YSL6_9NOCA|nr:hypothetical protein [Nocardia flavorosea]NKY60438.1 hypothetical protein [Nocardia flavorosea]
MYVPQEEGLYWDVQGDLWARDPDGWRWLGRRLPFTGAVVPADPGHGPLPDRELGMLVESPDDAVLPLRRVRVGDYPPD